jgi:hypothetical protein
MSLVFGWSVFLPGLCSARVGEWEFIERAKEESRFAPVIGITLSKNQTEPDGLVGSPKSCPVHHREFSPQNSLILGNPKPHKSIGLGLKVIMYFPDLIVEEKL